MKAQLSFPMVSRWRADSLDVAMRNETSIPRGGLTGWTFALIFDSFIVSVLVGIPFALLAPDPDAPVSTAVFWGAFVPITVLYIWATRHRWGRTPGRVLALRMAARVGPWIDRRPRARIAIENGSRRVRRVLRVLGGGAIAFIVPVVPAGIIANFEPNYWIGFATLCAFGIAVALPVSMIARQDAWISVGFGFAAPWIALLFSAAVGKGTIGMAPVMVMVVFSVLAVVSARLLGRRWSREFI